MPELLDKLDVWMFDRGGENYIFAVIGISFLMLIWLIGYYCGKNEGSVK